DVTGHGDSSAKPDMMTLSFTVTSHSESADECTRKESDISRRVVEALKTTLGDTAKITTSDYSFNPSIEYGNAMPTPVTSAPEPSAPEPATWQFKGEVGALTDTMDPVADLIEAGLAAGATSVGESGVAQIPEDWDATAPPLRTSASGAVGNGAYRRFRRMYHVALSVETEGESAADAMRKGIALMNRVEKALQSKIGGGQGKVQVDDFGVNQLNPQQQAAMPRYQPYVQQPQRKVYDARMTISAETPKLDLLGPSVEAAVKAGAAQLNQVTFSLKDDAAARKEAIEKARRTPGQRPRRWRIRWA
ncbi:MAG TPA: SIMPL domain-containing protein, partial [Patescibacteria group bacterium]|nr:SIMPL domain-containing protein [Patescibacteria group bacterium]